MGWWKWVAKLVPEARTPNDLSPNSAIVKQTAISHFISVKVVQISLMNNKCNMIFSFCSPAADYNFLMEYIFYGVFPMFNNFYALIFILFHISLIFHSLIFHGCSEWRVPSDDACSSLLSTARKVDDREFVFQQIFWHSGNVYCRRCRTHVPEGKEPLEPIEIPHLFLQFYRMYCDGLDSIGQAHGFAQHSHSQMHFDHRQHRTNWVE